MVNATRMMTVFHEGLGTGILACWAHRLRVGTWPDVLEIHHWEDYEHMFYDLPHDLIRQRTGGGILTFDCQGERLHVYVHVRSELTRPRFSSCLPD